MLSANSLLGHSELLRPPLKSEQLVALFSALRYRELSHSRVGHYAISATGVKRSRQTFSTSPIIFITRCLSRT